MTTRLRPDDRFRHRLDFATTELVARAPIARGHASKRGSTGPSIVAETALRLPRMRARFGFGARNPVAPAPPRTW